MPLNRDESWNPFWITAPPPHTPTPSKPRTSILVTMACCVVVFSPAQIAGQDSLVPKTLDPHPTIRQLSIEDVATYPSLKRIVKPVSFPQTGTFGKDSFYCPAILHIINWKEDNGIAPEILPLNYRVWYPVCTKRFSPVKIVPGKYFARRWGIMGTHWSCSEKGAYCGASPKGL